MEYHDRLAGITVKGEVQIIHAHITVLQCKKQIIQISGLILNLHSDHLDHVAEISCSDQSLHCLIRLRNYHSYNSVLCAVIGYRAQNVDILVLQDTGNVLHNTLFIFCIDG